MIKIAFRNILANKRRSLFTLLSISVGSMSLLLALGFMRATFDGLEANSISEKGHLQVFAKGYFETKDILSAEKHITNYKQIAKLIQSIEEVDLVTPRISFNGIIGNESTSKTMLGEAFVPENERAIGTGGYFAPIQEGDYFYTDETDAALIGSGLAKKLNVSIDDYLTILISTSEGGLNSESVLIKGIIEYSVPEYNDAKINVNINLAQKLLNTNSVDLLVLLLNDDKNINFVKSKLENLFLKNNLNLEIKTWEELSPYYISVKNLYTRIFIFLLSLIIIIMALSIVNSVIVSVYERFREIGTIRAIGTQKSKVGLIFFYESAFVGIFGWILSIILTFVVSQIILSFNIVMPPPPGKLYSYSLTFNILQEFYLFSLVICFVTSVGSGIVPALKASKINIINAIRFT